MLAYILIMSYFTSILLKFYALYNSFIIFLYVETFVNTPLNEIHLDLLDYVSRNVIR